MQSPFLRLCGSRYTFVQTCLGDGVPTDKTAFTECFYVYIRNKSSFAIKTVKFKPKEGATIIQASKKEDKYVFYSSYGETYEWVVDLKEMQAQRILNSYCAQLSRVGLNESEWLRLIAKQ